MAFYGSFVQNGLVLVMFEATQKMICMKELGTGREQFISSGNIDSLWQEFKDSFSDEIDFETSLIYFYNALAS